MLKQSHPIQNLFGATRYECLNCGNTLYCFSPPTDPCLNCGFGPDSEPEPAPDYEEVEVTAYECNRCHNTMWYERAPTGPCPICAFGDGDDRSDNWKFYTEVKAMRTKPNPQERSSITVRRYECLRCGNALYFTSPPTGPCPYCGLGNGDDLPADWTYYATAIYGKPALTPTKDGEARVAQWVAFCQNCSYPNRFTEKPNPASDDGCFSCGLPIHRPVHEIDQDARGDSSFYAAEKKRKKQGSKYWRKRFEDQLFAIQQLATFYDPDLRKYPADYWSFSPAYSVVYDQMKAMSDELARLEGIEEECKLLARRLNAVERLAIGDNAPVDEELNSDAYQAVRARLDADYPQKPLSERMIWADCYCERCKHLPSEHRVRLLTALLDYDPHNTLYKAMLKHIFERDAKR